MKNFKPMIEATTLRASCLDDENCDVKVANLVVWRTRKVRQIKSWHDQAGLRADFTFKKFGPADWRLDAFTNGGGRETVLGRSPRDCLKKVVG